MTDKIDFDREYMLDDNTKICGIDEVGRGCLFGSVVAAAVIMPISRDDLIIEGIEDSKKLTDKKRRQLFDIIIRNAISYSVESVSVEEIDKVNIYNATKIAMLSALKNLSIKPDVLLIDAMRLNSGISEYSIIKGDYKSYSIGAASIIAKVSRDNMMLEFAKEYPEYALDKNKGYGTKAHIDAIYKHGITKEHRRTFAPVSDIIGGKNERDSNIF